MTNAEFHCKILLEDIFITETDNNLMPDTKSLAILDKGTSSVAPITVIALTRNCDEVVFFGTVLSFHASNNLSPMTFNRVTFKIKDQAFNYTYVHHRHLYFSTKYAKCECHKGSP